MISSMSPQFTMALAFGTDIIKTFCLSKYTMVLGEINVLSCHDNSSSGWEQRTMGEILQVLAPHKD